MVPPAPLDTWVLSVVILLKGSVVPQPLEQAHDDSSGGTLELGQIREIRDYFYYGFEHVGSLEQGHLCSQGRWLRCWPLSIPTPISSLRACAHLPARPLRCPAWAIWALLGLESSSHWWEAQGRGPGRFPKIGSMLGLRPRPHYSHALPSGGLGRTGHPGQALA